MTAPLLTLDGVSIFTVFIESKRRSHYIIRDTFGFPDVADGPAGRGSAAP